MIFSSVTRVGHTQEKLRPFTPLQNTFSKLIDADDRRSNQCASAA